MKKNRKKIIIGMLSVLGILLLAFGLYVVNMLGYFNSGNSSQYSLESVETISDSPLKDKHLIFLGSSVTAGMQSKGISFIDFMAERDGFTFTKEAVSGTTLVDNNDKSYIQRLQTINDQKADLFICQLSTNDAQKELSMGEISESKKIEDFDKTTIIGAMEYIIAYSQEKWNVPIMFYTGTEFDNEQYPLMIDVLYELQEKWGIGVINLWEELPVDAVDAKTYKEYMNDPIHPTRRGYMEWWMPQIEKDMISFLETH
ncbi:MAG: SGNH/GDSL hydrolase family protein [Lactovum sp.]